jgi:uncharacterized protein YndB with AHSA1/START domain
MKAVLALVAVIVLAVAVVLFIGWRLPVKHVATRELAVPASPETVYRLISTVDEYPKWRGDVKSIERLDSSGVMRFRENGSNGAILFEVSEQAPPRRFVTRIADPSLPFGGTWTYEVTPAATGSNLRITENGEVYNPLFRFVSRYVMGHTATLDAYLASVSTALKKE